MSIQAAGNDNAPSLASPFKAADALFALFVDPAAGSGSDIRRVERIAERW
jgi:hypothetical protein